MQPFRAFHCEVSTFQKIANHLPSVPQLFVKISFRLSQNRTQKAAAQQGVCRKNTPKVCTGPSSLSFFSSRSREYTKELNNSKYKGWQSEAAGC